MFKDDQYFYSVVLKHKLYSNQNNLKNFLTAFFGATSFTEKKVLDIGGGEGLLSFYAIQKGASKAICLEPEAAGSSSGYAQKFNTVCSALGFENRAILLPVTFQDFDPGGETFDIVSSHDSINHLDETACCRLHTNQDARAIYLSFFNKLRGFLNPGGVFIIGDCSRYNFFQLLGIQNPIARTIEWHKHQDPAVWVSLLREAGFTDSVVRWSSFHSLGYLGRILLGNRFSTYFLHSYFYLMVKK